MPEPVHLVAAETTAGDDRLELRSFELFFETHYDRLFGALCLVTRDRHEAEEIAQDAFLNLFERWERIGMVTDPPAYLYRTAMNVFRKRRRRALMALRRAVRSFPEDDAMARVDAEDATVRALAPLPARQRACVVLTDLLGFSSEEAGRLLGLRASTVRVHTSRAHAALRTTLGGSR